jgi:hypothetical protein
MSLSQYTNDYISKSNLFYEDKRTRVFVLVESENDITFWRFVLSKYSNYIFEITENKASIAASERIPCAKGKDALMHMKNLGKNKIICIDADFDLIIDNYHTYTDRLRNESYIVNTEYYAIENILCDGRNLEKIIHKISDFDCCEDCVSVMSQLSKSIYDLICIYLASLDSNKSKGTICNFKVKNFNNELNNFLKIDLSDLNKSLSDFTVEYHSKFLTTIKDLADEILKIKTKLASIGYSEEDSYKIINGHTLFKLIICKLYIQQVSIHNKVMKDSIQYNKDEFKNELYSCTTLDECMIPFSVRQKLDLLYT